MTLSQPSPQIPRPEAAPRSRAPKPAASRQLWPRRPEKSGGALITMRLGSPGSLVAAIAGLVNGTGSVGAVLQGLFASHLVSWLGWQGLFALLAAAMLAASIALQPAVSVEAKARITKAKAS